MLGHDNAPRMLACQRHAFADYARIKIRTKPAANILRHSLCLCRDGFVLTFKYGHTLAFFVEAK